jgi:hypothetical protein
MRIRQRDRRPFQIILQLLALLEVLQLRAVTQRRDPGDVIGDPVRIEPSFVIVKLQTDLLEAVGRSLSREISLFSRWVLWAPPEGASFQA